MTVYPQEYKLNCIKIGFPVYDIKMNIGSTALATYTGCNDENSNSPCPGTIIDNNNHDNYAIRYTVNITWDGMTVSSGSISHSSTTGDQMYQCIVRDRTRTLTIKGNINHF